MKIFQIYLRRKILASVAFLFFILHLSAQTFPGLTKLENVQTSTYYSEGSEEYAKEMAKHCDQVKSFYGELIQFQPEVSLLVLSKEDWPKFTRFPVYGMPHYSDNKTLIVASEDNDFWKSFIPPLDQLPPDFAAKISKTYTDSDGNLTMRGFFNLLAIHELGHAYHIQGGLTMQRKWMGELFANIMLHTYIAENEPDLLPVLTVFPEMVVASTSPESLEYTSLGELESNYEKIGQEFPLNYGWYQCRWHKAAGEIYDAEKIQVFLNLWKELKQEKNVLNDADLAKMLTEKVGQSVADVLLKWDE